MHEQHVQRMPSGGAQIAAAAAARAAAGEVVAHTLQLP